MKPGHTAPPRLRNAQRVAIIRLRLQGAEFKIIARQVGCTPMQAIRCWQLSKPGMVERRRRIERNSKQRTRGQARMWARKQAEARAELAAQIAAAKAEAPTAPLYRGGPFE